MLIVALVSAAVTFFYVSSKLSEKQRLNDEYVQNKAQSSQTQEVDFVEEKSVPLKELPMNDSQKKVVETMGIDVETYVITPQAIDCAKEKLGEERVDEIVNGAAPGLWESAQIIPCL